MGKIKGWTIKHNANDFMTFANNKRTMIRIFNEKHVFPISGYNGYVVEKMILPTMKKGSQSTILSRHKTKQGALESAKVYMRSH